MRAVLLALVGLAAITAGLTLCPWLGPWSALLVDGALVLFVALQMETGAGGKAGKR